jgi:hypothetical protein
MQYYPYQVYETNEVLGEDLTDYQKKQRAFWAAKFVIAGKAISKAQAQQIALDKMNKVLNWLKSVHNKGESQFTTNDAQSIGPEIDSLNAMIDIYNRIYKDSSLSETNVYQSLMEKLNVIAQWEPKSTLQVKNVHPIVIGRPQSVPSITVDPETGEASPEPVEVLPAMKINTTVEEVQDLKKTLSEGAPLSDKQKTLHIQLQEVYRKPEIVEVKEAKKTNTGLIVGGILAAGVALLALRG